MSKPRKLGKVRVLISDGDFTLEYVLDPDYAAIPENRQKFTDLQQHVTDTLIGKMLPPVAADARGSR